MKYQAIDSDYIREMKEYDEFMREKKWLYKGLKYGYWLAIFIILLSAFLNGNMVLAQTSNIDYEFENGYAYNGLLPDSTAIINMRNTTELVSSGNYSATYSFEGDANGSNPTGWVVVSEGGGYVDVVNNYLGHSKVLEMNDSSAGRNTINNFFSSPQVFGTFEMWYLSSDVSKLHYLYPKSGSIVSVYIVIDTDFLKYYDGGYHNILEVDSDTWYHLSIDFECGDGGYKGLGADEWYITIDGVRYGAYSLIGTGVDNLTNLAWYSDNVDQDYSLFIDALGYSWDDTYYSGTSFDVGSEDTEPCGMTWDGTNFWISGLQSNDVYQYTDAGVYTTTHYDVGSEDIYPQGITWDGTNFWIVGSQNDEVYKYTDAWVYTGVHFDTSSESTYPNGIAWDGNDFWITDGFDDEVYKYNSSGIYTEVHFDTSSESTGSADIIYTGNHFLVIGYDNEMVYRYTLNGIYDGLYFDYGNEDFAMESMTFDGENIWMGGLENTDIYEYEYIENPYNIGDNLIATLVETNITETDKFEFTFDSSGFLNDDGDDDVSGFTDIENDYWSGDAVNVYPSIDDDMDKAIRITSAQLGECGIERDFDTDYVNTSQVHWQIDLIEMGYPETEIFTKIYNNASQIIAWLKLNGSYSIFYSQLADLSYYDVVLTEWVLLQSDIPTGYNYNMTFQLDWTNGTDYLILSFDDSNYMLPCLVPQDSIGNVQIYGINDHNIAFNTLNFQIDWVRVIVNGTSLSDELMPDNIFILSGDTFSLLYQSFIEITFDISYENNITIYLNDDILLLDYTYNATAEMVYFRNLYQDKSYSGLFLKIYNSTDYYIESIKVYGIQLVNQQDSSDNPFLEFSYSEIDPNVSYFYVSENDLYYSLETDDNAKLEYIQATFNIEDLVCEGYAVAFSHKKGDSELISESRVGFLSETYLSFLSYDIVQSESLILPQDKTIKEIVFLITDDNNEIIDTTEGYFSGITFIYYVDIETTITTLSLIEILPMLILLIFIPLVLYYASGKNAELIVPSIVFISIFGTAIEIIPMWLEVVILFSCLMFYIIRRKVR